MNNSEIANKIRGCLYGSLIGDSLATRYEFLSKDDAIDQINLDKNNNLLPMLGEGPFHLKPGQITDDGELSISLLNGIIDSQGLYDLNIVAQYYLQWFKSNPFDIGRTTSQAFKLNNNTSGNPYDIIKNNSSTANFDSLSNGCLMRASPLGILGYFHPDQIHLLAEIDCSLTNPNPMCINAVEIYITAIALALSNQTNNVIYNNLMNIANDENATIIKASYTTQIVYKNGKEIRPDSKQMGYYGIALQNALYHLFHNTSYADAMESTIKLGGDTDTNCCILGGLLGAKYGIDYIPKEWIKSVTTLTNPAYNRFNKLPIIKPANIKHSIETLIKLKLNSH
jgi:ADP-ribosyl-[dinitrogen reductase] hydrolase